MTYEDAQVPPADSSPFSREEWDRLDAENVALRKERDALRELMNCYNLGGWTDAEQLQKERDEARSERDALRLDAERYRWLRQFAGPRSNELNLDEPDSPEACDAAIDAARKGKL